MSKKNPDIESIFLAALEKKSPDQRSIYLDQMCGGDEKARRQVEDLLAANADMGQFLDKTREGEVDSLVPEAVGTTIGRYKLLQVIGEGGMGVVYMAQQDKPVQRKVALKIIKLGMDTKEFVARFEAERQALAMMDHPNIARALDAGATETGRPYFVMELVQGISITDFCDRSNLPIEQRLKLFIDVCRAVQSAHQKGIIHRDIKPSNVLVTLHHGEPMPKVIDFGVAKAVNLRLTEKTYFTRFATMIGTPAYMSPEQAKMSSMDVDTRTDVYSLGVLLYRLLTGSTPFSDDRLRSAAFGEMQRIIVEEEPDRPSTRLTTSSGNSQSEGKKPKFDSSLARDMEGELDWITLKCLEKDRGRRYETPNELAADVRRFLDEEPVLAVAPTLAYQLKKLYQRHRSVARLMALLLLALVVGLGVSSWQWMEADSARQVAVDALNLADEKTKEATKWSEDAKREAEKTRQAERETAVGLYSSNIVRGRLEYQAYNTDGANAILDHCEESLRGWEWHLLKQRVRSSMFTLNGHADIPRKAPDASWVYDVTCSPDGRWIASAGGGNPFYSSTPGRSSGPGEIIIWDAETGQQIHTLRGHEHVIHDIAFSGDSKTLASVSYDKTVRLWDVATGNPLKTIDVEKESKARALYAVAFSPDGKYLAAGGGVISTKDEKRWAGQCWIWTLPTYERQSVMRHEPDFVNRSTSVQAMRFSPDSKTLYSKSGSLCLTPLKAWDLENKRDIPIGMPSVSFLKKGLGIDPSGEFVVASSAEFVQFWNRKSGEFENVFRAHEGNVEDVVFNPNGSGQFATCGVDSTIRVWKNQNATTNGQPPLMTLLGHTGRVLSLDYSPDGNRLVSSGSDGSVRVWDLSRNFDHADVRLPGNEYGKSLYAMAFNPDSSQLSVSRYVSDILTIDVADRTVEAITQIRASRELTFCLDETATVAVGTALQKDVQVFKTEERGVFCWDLPSGRKRSLMITEYDAPIKHVICTAKARRIATSSGQLGLGQFGATDKWDGKTAEVKVWDGANGDVLFEIAELDLAITRIAFSPSGDRLAVACKKYLPLQNGEELKYKNTIRVYDVATNQKIEEFDDINESTLALAFDREGNRLAAAGVNRRDIIIWDLSPAKQKTIAQGIPYATDLAFSPDGNRLAVVSKFETKVINAGSGDELLVLHSRHQRTNDTDRVFTHLCWSHDGRSLAVGPRSLSIWTIPDSNAIQPTNQEFTLAARRRAISYRLHGLLPLKEKYNDRIRKGMEFIVDAQKHTLSNVPFNSAHEYRMRAAVFEFMNEPEKAAADIDEAELLEKQGVEE